MGKKSGSPSGSPTNKGSSLNTAAVASSSGPSKKPTKKLSLLSKIYLIIYNFGQVGGWSYLLYQLTTFYLNRSENNQTLWDHLGRTVIIFQNAALLEIIHAATGIVPSNVVVTTFQVFSRVMVVCGVLLATPNAIFSPGLPLALLAWSITEIIRYGYYGLNILNAVPQTLVWLRYSTFYILYPIGVTGELLCLYWAQSYARSHTVWSIEMPNRYNFTFSYFYFLWIVMFLYIPIFPHLYLHMIVQRKKTFGKSAAATAASKQKAK